jgi:N-acetyltransferase 10
MPKKKVDSRIRTLIENGIRSNTRSLVVIVGDRGKDQVVNLHYMQSKLQVKARPSVLWCYNKELGFSTHRKKRMRQIQKMQQRGLYDSETEDPFQLFITATKVRWCYYKDTPKVLGQTFGCCVLQDFESITPNILCRTVETVEGGGLVVLLLKSMTSLKQLYAMAMDAHSRFRTEAHTHVVPRFNERFLLSLTNCKSALVLDDELNILPLSKHAASIVPLAPVAESAAVASSSSLAAATDSSGNVLVESETKRARELASLQSSLEDTDVVGALISKTRTMDQANALLTCAEAISDKRLAATVAVTAGRGRGKSAAMGLSVAAALGFGYANIFVTAPHPDNLRTFFEFVVLGLNALAFAEHTDYEVIASTNPSFNKAPVRVAVSRGHRQTVQYIRPEDATRAALAQAELLVVDEAAAIPLPRVRAMLGPYLVFLASTTNGYEGTGRSLSLKLVKQLRQQQLAGSSSAAAGADAMDSASAGSAATAFRALKEVTLEEPIRYAPGDAVESWLYALLCLGATTATPLAGSLPLPSECSLYEVDRDALFSYHTLAEGFLHQLMSLFVSSHYKNSPNDLQMLADSPSQRIFVLLGPVDAASGRLPDILCAVQISFEGAMSKRAAMHGLKRGYRAAGDLIPWTLSQQFQDTLIPTLSGARIVRIATHPSAQRKGYGTHAIHQLTAYFQGKLGEFQAPATLGHPEGASAGTAASASAAAAAASGSASATSALRSEKIRPRETLPALLVAMADRPAECLHWLGVSYGLTQQLFEFWTRAGYAPLYVRHTPNDLTGEHTCIALLPLQPDFPPVLREAMARVGFPITAPGWVQAFGRDFARRFVSLLTSTFREFPAGLGLAVTDAAVEAVTDKADAEADAPAAPFGTLTHQVLDAQLTAHDMQRLHAYSKSLVDFHLILDLMPAVARAVFLKQLGAVRFAKLQMAVLLAVGLQGKTVDAVAREFGAPVPSLLALFNKAIRKVSSALTELAGTDAKAAAATTTAAESAGSRMELVAPAKGSSQRRRAQEASSSSSSSASAAAAAATVEATPAALAKYAVAGTDEQWHAAVAGADDTSGVTIAVAAPPASAKPAKKGSKSKAKSGKPKSPKAKGVPKRSRGSE